MRKNLTDLICLLLSGSLVGGSVSAYALPTNVAPSKGVSESPIDLSKIKDAAQCGKNIEKEVNLFIDDYNRANPSYFLNQKSIDALLKFSDGKSPSKFQPSHSIHSVESKILAQSDRVEPTQGYAGTIYSSETLPTRHRSEQFAQSVWNGSCFGNPVASVETVLTYLYARYYAEAKNRRALASLILGFSDFKFNKAYAEKYRNNRAFWYNSATWGVGLVLGAMFFAQFLRPRLSRFKYMSEKIDSLVERFKFKIKPEAFTRPKIDPEKLPSTYVLNEHGYLVETKPIRGQPSRFFRFPIPQEQRQSVEISKSVLQWGRRSATDLLLGDMMTIPAGQRLKYFLYRTGNIAVAAMLVGGARDGLEHLRMGPFNAVGVSPEVELAKVYSLPIALRLSCDADELVTQLASRNYALASSDQYAQDVEKLNSLVEDYAFVRIPFQGYDSIDLKKMIARVNAQDILAGKFSLNVNSTGEVTFVRQYNNARFEKSFMCQKLAGYEPAELNVSMKHTEELIQLAASEIEGAKDLQNIEHSLQLLDESLQNNPSTASAAASLEQFDFVTGDASTLPPEITNVLNYYANALIEIKNEDVFNRTVAKLVARANSNDGTSALLKVLQNKMEAAPFAPLRHLPSEYLAPHQKAN